MKVFYTIGRFIRVQSNVVSTLCENDDVFDEKPPAVQQNSQQQSRDNHQNMENNVNGGVVGRGGESHQQVVHLNDVDDNKVAPVFGRALQLKKLRYNAVREQWIFIAAVIERINMILYVTAVCLTPIFMFQVVPMTQK